jgi:hypothetical protein
MKNQVRILFAVVLCLFICQINVEGQIYRKAPAKASGPVTKVSPNDVVGKVSPTDVAGKNTGVELQKNQAKPIASNEKNTIIDIRSYAGMQEGLFAAKMKSQGYEKSKDDLEMGMTEYCYKSKTTGSYLSVSYGTKSNGYFVRSVSIAKDFKNPDLPTIKKTFLDYGKQCTDLKAEFKKGEINGVNGSNTRLRVKNSADWISKCLPELDRFVNAKQPGNAYQDYDDAGYSYSISFSHSLGLTYIVVSITDLTVNDNRG